MDRLVLERTIFYEGHDVRGFSSMLRLEPTRNTGWVWNVGGKDIPIMPDIMECRPRRVALVYGKHKLNEFEHIGILRAAGLQHVRISCTRAWPPYDGGSFALWQAVIPHVRKDGILWPCRITRTVHYALPKNGSRWVSYSGDGNDCDILRTTGLINFRKIKEGDYRFGYVYPKEDMLPLVRARTLGWPRTVQLPARIASLFGWPHFDKILWPDSAPAGEVLEETGRHRLLDMLAILNFAAPAETYLAGTLHSCMGNHATDLGLLKKLAKNKVVSFPEAT